VPVGAWPQLQHLDLAYNNFKGALPSQPTWTRLLHYETRFNFFTGGLSVDVGFWTSLVGLIVEGQLTGTIPSEIGRCTNLQELFLSNNAFTGIMPSNELTGQIPSELAKCTELQTLHLHNHALTGPISSELATISTLKELSILSTNITGPVPNATMWTNLVLLDLSLNRLSGTLPPSIGLWTSLASFSVTGNRMNGTLNNLLSTSLPLLDNIAVSDNMFSGPLYDPTDETPASTWFPSLQSFVASSNSISGSLPSALARWTLISTFQVSNNSMTGTIPPALAESWSMLSFGSFQGNLFQGYMPFCNNTDSGSFIYIDADCGRIDFSCDCCTC
jgi:hypothetical protein